ncbi:MAG TPA: RND family transporter [Gammaproteobacteria bacterium]|nr:RND family transporter [Gammaproteobacteria bacterium]
MNNEKKTVCNEIAQWVFHNRLKVLLFFAISTLLLIYSATHVRLDAGFKKLLPANHEYMQTFFKYRKEFGGANRILIAISVKDGDIFTKEYFAVLKAVTDEVFFIPGIERSSVTSLFTPNTRFVEVIEGGFAGGNVIPAGFVPNAKWFDIVRANILKSGKLGRLVSSDFKSAMISANLLTLNSAGKQKINYLDLATRLEKLRQQYQGKNIEIQIIGFSKLIGDVVEGLKDVGLFFIITLLVTTLLIYIYTRSWRLTLLPLVCSITAVVWQLGLLPVIGYGIDPMSILVPFLVFAIGISHGIQMVNAVRVETNKRQDACKGAMAAFRQLLVPGSVALISDTLGFLTILLIDIGIIREMAIAASVGIAVILLTNLFLLPVLLSYMPARCFGKTNAGKYTGIWKKLADYFTRKNSIIIILAAIVLMIFGAWEAAGLRIGDLEAGAPELRPDSRYNRDIKKITGQYSIGVDVLTIIAEAGKGACTKYSVMEKIDRFAWRMQNVEGVQSVISLPQLAKIVNAGWNEGSLKWRALSRNQYVLAQSVTPFDTSTGLLNSDCSVMAVYIFTRDHKAETIAHIVNVIKKYESENSNDEVSFKLASGNIGVMAATNEAVEAAQLPMLIYVYAAIVLLCILGFRSIPGTLCIVIPLALVSILTYALMVYLNIGLKVATLPVVALGVGIGVDYGIYIYSRLREYLADGLPVREALFNTFTTTGHAVLFTALTLAMGVSTWIFSDLKFQADMGILLTFVFIANMLAAMVLLPALATLLLGDRQAKSS